MLRLLFLSLIVTLNCFLAFSQISKIGVPYIHNYLKSEYKAGSQNYSITQGKNGIMYFANDRGLLEYDGNKWQLYTLPDLNNVRSVFTGNQGRIYVGGNNEFGYFFPNKQGVLSYNSLLKKLPPDSPEIGEIKCIYETHYGIVFQSSSNLLICKDTLSANIVLNDSNLNMSFYVNKILYINTINAGVLKYDGSIFKPVVGGETFKNKALSALLTFERNKLLIATKDNGLFILDQFGAVKWDNAISELAIEYGANSIIKLENIFAMSTNTDGILFFDHEGNTIQHININKGLQDNCALVSFIDKEKNLWLGTNNGIDFVSINSPVSYINKEQYIGSGYSSVYFNYNLYLATNQGLYYKSEESLEKPFSNEAFKKVENVNGPVWNVSVHGDRLICGNKFGTFDVTENNAKIICNESGGWKYIHFPDRPDIMIGAMQNGLALFSKGGGKDSIWRFLKMVEGFKYSIREMEIDRDGNLWIGEPNKGIYKVLFNESLDTIVTVSFYNSEKGLPFDNFNGIFTFNNNVYCSSKSGIYEYFSEADSFKKNVALSQLLGDSKIEKLFEDATGSKWYFQNEELKVLRLNFNGNYTIEKVPLGLYKGSFIPNSESINFIDNYNILIATEDGFIHFNPALVKREQGNLKVLLRSIRGIGDTLIFGGNYVNNDGSIVYNRQPDQMAHIMYSLNNLKFEFSDNSYSENQPILYRTFLENCEHTWSEWSSDKVKYYNNLRTGNYIFHLKGKREDGTETNEVIFKFEIYPPWYRSLYAYTFFIILVIGCLFLFIRFLKIKIERNKSIILFQQESEKMQLIREFSKEISSVEEAKEKLHNEKLQIELDHNKLDVEWKSRELAAFAIHLTHVNDILSQLKDKLVDLSNKVSREDSKKQILALIESIEKDMEQKEDWEKFESYFNRVHDDFLQKLLVTFPELTHKDLRLAAYLRMNLSSKEIAALLNISIRGVEISRYRLRKKLEIDRNIAFNDFLMNF